MRVSCMGEEASCIWTAGRPNMQLVEFQGSGDVETKESAAVRRG